MANKNKTLRENVLSGEMQAYTGDKTQPSGTLNWSPEKATMEKNYQTALAGSPNANADYYQALKDENYKTLLTSEIQLSNARQRALKNTQTALGAMGMGSSGYGSTVRTGLEGQYLSGLENAQQNYMNQQNQIGLSQAQANQTAQQERFNTLTALMGQATTNDDLNKVLVNYGLGYMDKNNNFVWNEQGLQELGENGTQIRSMYDLINSQNNQNATGSYFNSAMEALQYGEFATVEELNKIKDLYNYNSMTDEQKKFFDYYYDQALKRTNQYQAENAGSKFAYTGSTYQANYNEGYGLNANFKFTTGSSSYSLEVGARVGSYATTGLKNDVAKDIYATKQSGEIWTHNGNNGTITFLTKSDNGDIKVVECSAAQNKKDFAHGGAVDFLKAFFGENVSYSGEANKGGVNRGRYQIDGTTYILAVAPDGSLSLFKDK